MNVIVVDDDPLILLLLQKLIQRKGHTVLTYTSPLDCPLYQANPRPSEDVSPCVDIIISDYNMPKVNGIEFLEAIRNLGCRCRNIALITANVLNEVDMIRMAKLGTRFFLKPIDFQQLYDWLDRVEQKAV